MVEVKRWGLKIGTLCVTWWDLWNKKPCLEFSRYPRPVRRK